MPVCKNINDASIFAISLLNTKKSVNLIWKYKIYFYFTGTLP